MRPAFLAFAARRARRVRRGEHCDVHRRPRFTDLGLRACLALVTAALFAVLPMMILAGCSDEHPRARPVDASDPDASTSTDGGADGREPPVDGGSEPSVLHFDDGFARLAHPRPLGGWTVVLERPVHIRERRGHPDRYVVFLDAHGREEARFAPAAGRELLDLTIHTSGEATALEASDEGYWLVRLDRSGARLRETLLEDDAIYTDPPAMNAAEPRSRIETHTHDTGRVVASSEGVLLATRTGRHSVVAYGVTFDPAAGYEPKWRTLVVPAHPIWPVGLTGGSYDTFGQLDAQYAVHLARDAAGIAYVAVQHARAEGGALVKAIEKVFGPLETDPDYLDLFVTRIAHDGRRLGLSVVGTPEDDQLYGLHGGPTGAIAVGRSELWNAQGTGFEALVGHVDALGKVTVDRFDVDLGDLAFDAVRTSSGDVVVVGASGYTQNPHGASISEQSHPFARVRKDGATSAAIPVPGGPRHGEARFVVALEDGHLLVGGMLDGPGTHSADGDEALLRARGFLAFVPPRRGAATAWPTARDAAVRSE